MIKQLFGILIVLAFCCSTITFAQDKEQKEMPKKSDKMEMTKSEMKAGPLKSVSCDPTCGFMCRSHDEKELTAIVKKHAKTAHKMDMTDKQVKDMMKTEGSTEMKQ
ncbi:MAG: DUF1059 domain-containing protein [Ignavibacteria bacterium]|nr:DUF1059 domain-containing protein [Ignavibacteria bacterium]